MAAFNAFDVFALDLGREIHNFSSDVIKLMLSNTQPAATNEDTGDITEITAGNGYSAGGMTLDSVTWTQSSGVATLDAADELLSASGGDIGPFRYVIIYNDSSPGDSLIGWYDIGNSQTILDGGSQNFGIDPNGILTVSPV